MKIFLVLATCSLALAKILPDDFPQCKRNDPELEKCLLTAVETVKPRILNGIPELNVPPLEPFNVPTLKLDRTANNLRLKANIKNMKAIGGSQFKVEKLRLNLNNKYVGEIKISIPKLLVSADYDVRGSRILTLDINGKGHFRSNITGITVVAKGSAKPIIKDGVEYLQAEKIVTKLRIKHAQVVIDDTERPVAADDFPQCKRNDPELEKCLLTAVETVKPRILNGIPELNVPPLEPFNVPTLKLDRTANNLRLKANIKNMKAIGGSQFKVEKLRLNLNNKYVGEIKISIPKLLVSADYDVRGSRILTLDINGKGHFRSNITGITVVAKGSAKPIIKDGVEYLQAEKIVTKLRIKHAQVVIDDTERPVAATSAAAFFNASPNIVLDILNPLIEESSAAIFKAFINKIFDTIPLKEILVE